MLKPSLLSGVRDSNGYKIRFLSLNQSRENLAVYGYFYSVFPFPTDFFFFFQTCEEQSYFFSHKAKGE